MIYTRPFATMRFIAYEGDSRTTQLSLAVQVIDAFTTLPPEVPIRVRLKELLSARPLRSISGFYCFEGKETVVVDGTPRTRTLIPDGNYTLVVESDPIYGNWYFNSESAVVVTSLFPTPVVLPMNPIQPPLAVVRLRPTPAYPFAANATLVRGKVLQAGQDAEDAVVSTDYDEVDPQDSTQPVSVHIETTTDQNGEFVLFFKRLFLANQAITLRAVKNGPPVSVNTQIWEGTSVIQPAINLP